MNLLRCELNIVLLKELSNLQGHDEWGSCVRAEEWVVISYTLEVKQF